MNLTPGSHLEYDLAFWGGEIIPWTSAPGSPYPLAAQPLEMPVSAHSLKHYGFPWKHTSLVFLLLPFLSKVICFSQMEGATNCSAIVRLTKNICAPLVLFCYEITPNPQAHIQENALGEAFYQTAYPIQEAAGNQSFLFLFLGPKSYDTLKPGWLQMK